MPFKNPNPIYHVWQSMLRRCDNKKSKQWKDYGGRGIAVCDRWLPKNGGFANFLSDMGERPSGHSLERLDNDKGYFPENCRWATKKEQQRNQRITRKVTISGKEYLACELADIAGIKTDCIIARVKRGLSYDQVVSKERGRNMAGLAIGWKYGCKAKPL